MWKIIGAGFGGLLVGFNAATVLIGYQFHLPLFANVGSNIGFICGCVILGASMWPRPTARHK